MASISKDLYIDKLDDIVKKHNNTYQSTIKMKPVDVKTNTYIDSRKDINDKDPKSKVGDTVRIPKYKQGFAKGYTPNWYLEVFVIEKVKNNVPQTYVVNYLNGKNLFGTFCEKKRQKTYQKEFRIEKVIKREGNELYVKWKRYNNLFNSWIQKKNAQYK